MIPNKATLWLKWDFHISQVSHPKNYQKGNGTWWHHYQYSKNTFKWYPYHIFPKKATVDHAIRCLCHRCHVKVLKNTSKMIPISHISKKGNSDDDIRCRCNMYCVKVLTNCCKMMPISYISKKGNGTWLHMLCCVVTLWGSCNIALNGRQDLCNSGNVDLVQKSLETIQVLFNWAH